MMLRSVQRLERRQCGESTRRYLCKACVSHDPDKHTAQHAHQTHMAATEDTQDKQIMLRTPFSIEICLVCWCDAPVVAVVVWYLSKRRLH
jgi:hypothetical protein